MVEVVKAVAGITLTWRDISEILESSGLEDSAANVRPVAVEIGLLDPGLDSF